MSRYLSFIAEDIPAEHLDAMVKTGLWGETENEALNHLLLCGIRDAIAGRIIDRIEPNVEDPEAAPVGTGMGNALVPSCPDCGRPLTNGACVSLECMPF